MRSRLLHFFLEKTLDLIVFLWEKTLDLLLYLWNWFLKLSKKSKFVVDTRNATKEVKENRDKIILL